MFEEAPLKWDLYHFVLNKKPYYFDDVTEIRLDMSLGSLLKWEDERSRALKAKRVVFYLDFGFGESFPSMDDMTPFLSLGLAIDTFGKLCKELGEKVIGAILLKGSEYFSPLTAWDNELTADIQSRFEELGCKAPDHLSEISGGAERLILEVFARDTVMGYVSLLASQLPSQVAGLIDVKGKGLTPFQEAYLFAPSAFGGVSRINSGLKDLPKVGMLLPELSKEFLELTPRFEGALAKLKALGLSFRSVNAEQFHEQWELLEVAIGMPGLMSPSAERQCMGFAAAGGQFVSLGSGIKGLESKSFEEFVTANAGDLITKAKMLKDPNRQTL